jgi:hypothetical protein
MCFLLGAFLSIRFIGKFDLAWSLMLLYGSVFDAAVTGADFPLF